MKGLGLAREAGTVLAWDERSRLTLLDLRGQQRVGVRAPGRIVAGAISDDGALVALLGEGSRLWLLGPDLGTIAERQAPPESSALAVDPHGRYVAVGSRLRLTQFYSRYGRHAGRLETQQPLASLCFIAGRPFLLGAAAHGLLVGIKLGPGGSSEDLGIAVAWQETLLSGVGRLAATGDGRMILASCFNQGVQRFDLRGHNEGAYHLGGTAAHAVPDFAGRTIAVATLEGELALLNPAGNVRWRTNLARPALALEIDPLGRFLIYGHETGEIVRLDLEGGSRRAAVAPGPGTVSAVAPRAGAGAIRRPDWALPVVATAEEAETAVVTVLDDPPRIGLMTRSNRLQVFTTLGQGLGQAPEIIGVGRILRTEPGWIAAATDRQVVLYDARHNAARRVDLSLVEITHLALRPDAFGLAVVQERDRIGRATLAGDWIWKHELGTPVEELALGPDGYAAATTTDGRLIVYDPSGQAAAVDLGGPSDPPLLIEAPASAPSPVTWLSLARRAQVLRGHDLLGKPVWEVPLPWEAWQLQRLGPIALVAAPDGRALAFDGAGRLRAQGPASDDARDVFGASAQGDAWRISRHGVHLMCSQLSGRVLWRTVAEVPLGPLAVGHSGVAALMGRSLAWFQTLPPTQ